MTEETSPENLQKFLKSDDPSMVRMGISLAKGAELDISVNDLETLLQHENIEIVKNGFEFAMENKRKEAIEAIPKFLLSKESALVKMGLSAAKDLDTKDNKLVIWVLSYFYGNSEAKEIVKNDPFYLGDIKDTIESIIYDHLSEELLKLIFTRRGKDLRNSPFQPSKGEGSAEEFIDIMGILAAAAGISLGGHIEELFRDTECPQCEGWDDDDNQWEIENDYCTNPDCNVEEVLPVLPDWLGRYFDWEYGVPD